MNAQITIGEQTHVIYPPEGYMIVGFRKPSEGEMYISFLYGEKRDAAQWTYQRCGGSINPRFILEKVHTPPEILFFVGENGLAPMTSRHEWIPIERLSYCSFGDYDGMICKSGASGQTWVCAGHWNDGLEESSIEGLLDRIFCAVQGCENSARRGSVELHQWEERTTGWYCPECKDEDDEEEDF